MSNSNRNKYKDCNKNKLKVKRILPTNLYVDPPTEFLIKQQQQQQQLNEIAKPIIRKPVISSSLTSNYNYHYIPEADEKNSKPILALFLIRDLVSIVSEYMVTPYISRATIRSCSHTCELKTLNCCFCSDKRYIDQYGYVEEGAYEDGKGLVRTRCNIYYCPTCSKKEKREDVL